MTNPETCLHRVLTVHFEGTIIEGVECVSCAKAMTDADLEGKKYEADIDNNVWVQSGRSPRKKAEK